MAALARVYRHPWYVALGVALAPAMALLFLWQSQVLIVGRSGLSLFIQPLFVAVAVVVALEFGLTVPMQLFAWRAAASSASSAGAPAAGFVASTASMTCCAPLLLPSFLSLLGFSGTTLLGLNIQLHRYFPVLATFSIILLTYALASAIQSLSTECRLEVQYSAEA